MREGYFFFVRHSKNPRFTHSIIAPRLRRKDISDYTIPVQQ
jgi:hypothetical protein